MDRFPTLLVEAQKPGRHLRQRWPARWFPEIIQQNGVRLRWGELCKWGASCQRLLIGGPNLLLIDPMDSWGGVLVLACTFWCGVGWCERGYCQTIYWFNYSYKLGLMVMVQHSKEDDGYLKWLNSEVLVVVFSLCKRFYCGKTLLA